MSASQTWYTFLGNPWHDVRKHFLFVSGDFASVKCIGKQAGVPHFVPMALYFKEKVPGASKTRVQLLRCYK